MMDKNENILKGIYSEGYGVTPKKFFKADLSSLTKLILLYLSSFTGGGDTCYPSEETIATDLKISRRSVIRGIKEAKEKNFISIDKKKRGQGVGTRNIYTLLFLKPDFASDNLSIASDNLSFAGDKNDSLQVTGCHTNNIINNNRYNNINNNKEKQDYTPFLILWNDFADKHDLEKPRKITDKIRTHLHARIAENKNFLDDFKICLEKLACLPFYLGKNDRNWKVTFRYLIKNNENYNKILEKKVTIPKDEPDVAPREREKSSKIVGLEFLIKRDLEKLAETQSSELKAVLEQEIEESKKEIDRLRGEL